MDHERFKFSVVVIFSYLCICGMSEVETLGYQDTNVLSINNSTGFGMERYSCGTKQALPCIEKLTGKDNHIPSLGYMLYFSLIIWNP